MESNDSHEIPDRGETSDIPGLPSGGFWIVKLVSCKQDRVPIESTGPGNCSKVPIDSMGAGLNELM